MAMHNIGKVPMYGFDAYRCQQANGTECLNMLSRFTRKNHFDCMKCPKKLLVRFKDHKLVKESEV